MGSIGVLLLIANGIVSWLGFRDPAFHEKYSFKVGEILVNKDYKRLITAAFLHVSWPHLLFNMLTLYFFSPGLEAVLGKARFLLIYFGSLIGGNLFSLFIQRNRPNYSAVGASGAISGILFASIALFPGMTIGFFLLPIPLPGWIYGLLYIVSSIYGIRSQSDNIGHEAHFGGGVIGLLAAIAMVPASLTENYLPIALILVPSLIFIYLVMTKRDFLVGDITSREIKGVYTVEDKYNTEKREMEKELDLLLDKISQRGFDSLSVREKERLTYLSRLQKRGY